MLRHYSLPGGMQCSSGYQFSLGGPAPNGPVWTGSAQIGLLYGTQFFFPCHAFPSCEITELTMPPFFALIFNELTNILNCFTVSTDSLSSFHRSHNENKQRQKKQKNTPHTPAFMELPWNMRTKGTWCNAAFIIDLFHGPFDDGLQKSNNR